MELNQLTLVAALHAIDRDQCSAEEIARACIDRIGIREAEVGAWHWLLDEEEILDHVRAAGAKSVLGGLLCGVKDTIDTVDMPTEYGSPLYAGHRPSADAVPVAILRRAGAVMPGKTVATEFAYFAPGKTVNPHDPRRTPGGSSSGSAAAVADCMVPFALGSQTAGSVIRPAAYCGCVGYVASHGELPIAGVRPLSKSLDTLGVFARSVEDVQVVRDVVLQRAPGTQSGERGPKRVRLAVCDGTAAGPIDDEMMRVVDAAAGMLAGAGATVEPLGMDRDITELTRAHEVVMAYEAARALALEPAHGDAISEPLRDLIAVGWATNCQAYRDAHDRISQSARRLSEVLSSVDAILAPAAPGAAPSIMSTGSPHASRPWQALGLPAVTLPVARAADGMPLGLQLIGRRHHDDHLLALAGWSWRRLSPLTTSTGRVRPSGVTP